MRGISKVYSSRLQRRNRIATPLPKNEAFKRFITYCAPKLHDNPPECVTSSRTLLKFSKQLRHWLFSLDYVDNFSR